MENNNDLPQNYSTGQTQLQEVKHDLRNQLSNMYLAIDQLRFELQKIEDNTFAVFCIDTIANSCTAINQILNRAK